MNFTIALVQRLSTKEVDECARKSRGTIQKSIKNHPLKKYKEIKEIIKSSTPKKWF